MNLSDTLHQTALAISAIPYLAGVPVIEEEKGDTSNRLAADIAKAKVAIIVGANGFKGDGNSSKTVYGTATIVVSVFEMPLVNRKSAGRPTLFNMAQQIAKDIQLFHADGMNAPLVFGDISPIREVGTAVTCDVNFTVKTTL